MMSTVMLETCREIKEINMWKSASGWLLARNCLRTLWVPWNKTRNVRIRQQCGPFAGQLLLWNISNNYFYVIVELYATVNDIKQIKVAQKCLSDKFLSLTTLKHTWIFSYSVRCFCDFNQIWKFSRDFHKSLNIRFHWNPSTGTRTDTCGQTDGLTDGQTDMTNMVGDFSDCANPP